MASIYNNIIHMKKQLFFCLLSLFLFSNLYSQSYKPDISKVQDFIAEVYVDVVGDLGYDTSEGIERFTKILNRFEIVNSTTNPENFSLLSQVPVIKTYNKDLKFDDNFDPKNFNPFKYKFEVFSKDKTVYYLVDNTDYIIIIHPEQKL